ncbi:DUF3313 domain-containing protein [Bradyrhizobium sp. JYMT SZCCT0180]|uniref:DUF3313 domain-containing protein n=1 Tax=Bradyrhizobium sp. JYMT SZCCT0180 TaxID=2807666 RepID=UPI001BAA82F4|nr:DUF3313 domain-containing protein [Bradyrhizobium sp. JYMT SZCCT0180]MBR1214242.1 DUF3313 domain-containing protein [Bradyrhizobium sp. JYMT SZCCT0180]
MKWIVVAALGWMAGGCTAVQLERSGSLASYDNLTPSDGLLTKSQVRVSKAEVLAAKTLRIEPTALTVAAARVPFSDEQRSLIKNAVSRAMCLALSERFRIVAPTETADLSVRAVIIHVAPTDATAAGVSKVASVVPSIVAPGVPIPVPRLPIGLGSLAVEAEARDRNGSQKAAMIWARGANSFTSSPRVSSDGDAYDLASAFGDDFGKLLVTAESPFGKISSPPSIASLQASLGGAPKEAACEAFGRAPGLVGMIGQRIGVPPDWTDRGTPANEINPEPAPRDDTKAVSALER